MEYTVQTWNAVTPDFRAGDRQKAKPEEIHQKGTPQPPTNGKKKLRESCDNCAVSKVRCSKDQPKCKRCEERGILCLFSPSRRSGKPCRVPIIERNATADSNTPSSGSTSPQVFQYHQESDRALHSPFSIRNLEAKTFNCDIMFWDYPLLDFDLGTFRDETPAEYASKPDKTITDGFHPRRDDTEYTVRPDSGIGCNVTPTANFASLPSKTPADIQARNNNTTSSIAEFPILCSQDCMVIALNISQVLHTTARTCKWFSLTSSHMASIIPDVEQILATNREAIDLVFDILRCPCSLERQLRLILTLVCTKLVSRYGMILSKEIHSRNACRQVRSHRTTTGECHVDSSGGRRATAQLVLSELYRLSTLVGQLAKRMRDSDQDRIGMLGGGFEARKKLESSAAMELEMFLRDEIQLVTEQAMDLLHDN